MNKKYFNVITVRAVKTFCQTAAALITAGISIDELNLARIIGISATAGLFSILTTIVQIATIEEKKNGFVDEFNKDKKED